MTAAASHTPGPWKWQGEDYRGDWGWQMLVGPNGEGLIVGQDQDGKMSPLLRTYEPMEPYLCVTGMMAEGKEHAECVHVYSEANAHLIAAAPELLTALKAVVSVADRNTVEFDLARAAIAKAEGRES